MSLPSSRAKDEGIARVGIARGEDIFHSTDEAEAQSQSTHDLH